jgi:acetyl/propionyl-CoA carboxylase alpha subunit
MRRVDVPEALGAAIASAQREAAAAFGDRAVFLERCLDGARHVEVQVLGDQHGHVVHLLERECSIQRRHQKLIEETPAPRLGEGVRNRLYAAALALARAIDYSSAGTVEFLVDGDDIAFLEMNTRLQVEHPVTEALTGLDLVRLQIEVARGEPLPFAQHEVRATGHAIEARLYAEDAAHDFLPAVGRVYRFSPDDTPMRWDSGIESGSEVSPFFDGLLAKTIAHAATRAEASARLARALRGLHVHGVQTNRDALVAIIESDAFAAAQTATDFLPRHAGLLTVQPPDDVARVHALAAALVARRRRLAAAPVLRFVPPGWRNVPGQSAEVRLGQHRVRLAVDQAGQLSACVDERELAGRVSAIADEWVDLDVHGIQARFQVHSVADRHYVNGMGWQTCLDVAPRFAELDESVAAAGPTAPVPGTVVAVLVDAGERVRAGQALVVLDAMKIEHQITADADARVAEVRVSAGQRVEAHQVLVVLEP